MQGCGEEAGGAVKAQRAGRAGVQDQEGPAGHKGRQVHQEDQHRRAAAALEHLKRGDEPCGAQAPCDL